MRKQEGCHFYINIKNLDEVVLEEENKTRSVEHSIHALDTFFSAIERYGKKNFPNTFHVEKVTGSRIHMYVLDSLSASFEVVRAVCSYAYYLTKFINKEVAKYKTLLNFKIQAGCCFGNFYDFVFKTESLEEETSIGFAANYAAKLQNLTQIDFLSISSNMYNQLDNEIKTRFELKTSPEIEKYKQLCYYTIPLWECSIDTDLEEDLEDVRNYANKVNLSEINFTMANKQVSFDRITKKDCKKVYGIPLFADVRNFTQQFDENDINLEEMAVKTQNVLTDMYRIVKTEGTHVQFQGDREFALYHDYGEKSCSQSAVIAGLRIIDSVKKYQVYVGVGQALGDLFLAKIGARGEKDNIVIGSTVTEADYYEDKCAEENQLVISSDIFDELKRTNIILAKQFQRRGSFFYTTVGYDEFKRQVEYESLKQNNNNRNYNGAWGK